MILLCLGLFYTNIILFAVAQITTLIGIIISIITIRKENKKIKNFKKQRVMQTIQNSIEYILNNISKMGDEEVLALALVMSLEADKRLIKIREKNKKRFEEETKKKFEEKMEEEIRKSIKEIEENYLLNIKKENLN